MMLEDAIGYWDPTPAVASSADLSFWLDDRRPPQPDDRLPDLR
ncbi:hypothetical protein [Catellatospora sichuanensis]|nr:hypothetical protein [Catellatospora sichuanensis]